MGTLSPRPGRPPRRPRFNRDLSLQLDLVVARLDHPGLSLLELAALLVAKSALERAADLDRLESAGARFYGERCQL